MKLSKERKLVIMSAEFVEEEKAMVAAGEKPITAIDKLLHAVNEHGYYASFDTETIEGKKLLYNARQSGISLGKYMDTPIDMTGYVFTPTKMLDKDTGEMKTMLAVVIVDAEGTLYFSAANGVCRSVAAISETFGSPDTWDAPLTVVCKSATTNAGNVYKYLDIV